MWWHEAGGHAGPGPHPISRRLLSGSARLVAMSTPTGPEATTPSAPAAPTARVTGISHVAISASDLDATRHFYVDVMGLTELRRPDFGVPGAWFRLGNLQLHVLVVPDVAPVGPGLPHLALFVETADIPTTVDALVAGGGSLLAPPSTRDDFGVSVTAAFVTDPDGNVIEITDVGPLAPAPAETSTS